MLNQFAAGLFPQARRAAGFNGQIFGAERQVSARGRCDQQSETDRGRSEPGSSSEMLKKCILAWLASLAMLSNANAAATVGFQTKVKHWYEEAPLALQRAIRKPRVAVYAVADMDELRAVNPRAADMKGLGD